MKTNIALLLLVCAPVVAAAQQPTPSPSPVSVRSVYRHRLPKRNSGALTNPNNARAQDKPSDYLMGDARVDITKDETVVRLAMAQHGSVLIELPANDGPRYIIPGDPEMATVDEKALERNKRAIVVRPGSLFVSPLPNHKARTPAATVTAQMRSGLVVTFLFYPVEDLAQNVHRCVLTYNRDEVVARRRAAGLPVNLDTVTNSNEERRVETGQSTAPTSILVAGDNDNKPAEKPSEVKPISTRTEPPKTVLPATPAPSPVTALTPRNTEARLSEIDEQIKTTLREALTRAAEKPKQFKKWTTPSHGLALAVMSQRETRNDFQLLLVAIRNTSSEGLKLLSGNPDLLIEMLDEQGKPINIQSLKKLQAEKSAEGDTIAPGATVYFAIAYAAPVLGAHQQIKVVVGQTNAADDPASIALSTNGR